MSKLKAVLKKLLIAAAIIGLLIYVFGNLHVFGATKDQDECPIPPAFATVGRCADKCPNETDTLLGFDQQTGAAICKAAPTGCPYGDSIPLDSPKCAPSQSQASITSELPANDEQPVNEPFGK
jgi:hypothetical protein